jgi:hypothetical protein
MFQPSSGWLLSEQPVCSSSRATVQAVGFSSRRVKFLPRWLRVRFIVDEVALRQTSFPVFFPSDFSPYNYYSSPYQLSAITRPVFKLRSSPLTRHLAADGVRKFGSAGQLFVNVCTLREYVIHSQQIVNRRVLAAITGRTGFCDSSSILNGLSSNKRQLIWRESKLRKMILASS